MSTAPDSNRRSDVMTTKPRSPAHQPERDAVDPQGSASDVLPDDRPFWKVAPLHRRDVAVLAASYVALTAIYLAVGWMIVNWWETSPLGESEADVNRWFEDQRSDQLTHLAELGSALSNTETKIAMVLGLLPLMLWMFRRWHEWTLIAVGLMFEVSVFGTTAKIIGRDRPPVEQLDGAPTNSWPSGHIAAAVVFYVGVAIVISWNPKFTWSRVAAICVAVAAVTIVTISRLYLGMHYVSDVIGGMILGGLSLLLLRHLLMRNGTMRMTAVPSQG